MNASDIIAAINAVAEKIFSSVEGEVFKNLDALLIISKDILTKEPLKHLVVYNKTGLVLLSTSFIILFATYYILSRLIAMYNGQEVENVWKYIIRNIVCIILSMSSMFLLTQMLNINEMFTGVITSVGKDLTHMEICFESLREIVLDLNKHMSSDFLSVDGLIKGVISFGSVTLLVNLAIRYVTVIFLVFISPIAFMLASSDSTFGVFKSWYNMLLSNLLMQNIIVVILIMPIAFKETNNSMYKIVLVGSIYLLYRVNNFSKELLTNMANSVIGRK